MLKYPLRSQYLICVFNYSIDRSLRSLLLLLLDRLKQNFRKSLKMIKCLLILAILPVIISHGYHIRPRIVNGVKIDTQKYPFFVQLETFVDRKNGKIQLLCGGSVLNDR